MYGMEYFRKLLGMTGSELAEMTNSSRSQISYWEKGKRKIPEKKMDELSQIFGKAAKLFDKEIESEEDAEFLKIEALKFLKPLKMDMRRENRSYGIMKIGEQPELEEIGSIMNFISQNPRIIPYINQLIEIYMRDEKGETDRLPLLLYAAAPRGKYRIDKLSYYYDREGLSFQEKDSKRRRLFDIIEIIHTAFRLVDNI